MTVEGAERALDDTEFAGLFPLVGDIDWSHGKERAKDLLVGRFGWEKAGRRSLRLASGVLATVLGSSSVTHGLTVWHTSWEVDHPDLTNLTFRRAEHLRDVVSDIVGSEPGIGELDTGEAYYWDRADGTRVWLDDEAIRFLSPEAARNERLVQQDPERYASYGENGEHA